MRDPLNGSMQSGSLSSLVIGWNSDSGRLGEAAVDFLISKLGGQFVTEIDPLEYFPMNGIAIEDDMIQFPESQFYFCPRSRLMLFKSNPPEHNWYRFFNQVLDIAEKYIPVKTVYIIGGMLSLLPHTTPRQLFGIYSSFELQEELSYYGLGDGMDHETPPGQKPTLNSYFLWAVRKRGLSGVNLWMPVPFYLMAVDDPRAQKQVLEFFNLHFHLELDLGIFDTHIYRQNKQFFEIRNHFPEIDDYIMRLESNQRLSEDENLRLVKQVEEFLKQDRSS